MPLTGFQAELGRLLACNRSEDSYLAGGAAILKDPRSYRFSRDLDYFHDSEIRVASAFKDDNEKLLSNGCKVVVELSQPGYIRAIVKKSGEATKVEWARDSTWRFMPVEKSEDFGYQLHPVDLATNKVLALAGRNEPRDLLDALFLHSNQLSLGALIWAAVGKDPGFSPLSLLEMLKRRGTIRPEELARIDLAVDLEISNIKEAWNKALSDADSFARSRLTDEPGCLFYSLTEKKFVTPELISDDDIVPHFGGPGGVLPRVLD